MQIKTSRSLTRHSRSHSFAWNLRKLLLRQWQFYVILAIPLAYIIVFAYVPMYGIVFAFLDYSPTRGIFGSTWVGLKHFRQFFSSPSSIEVIINTLWLGVYGLVAGFPIPILLAIALNEIGSKSYKKVVQMVTYAPYFISTVVLVGMILQITDLRLGIINNIIEILGGKRINFMAKANLFASIYVWSGIWQGAGYGSIIYLAALSSVDPQLQEAAIVDGASRVKRIWHVDLPAIRPQIIILLLFNLGRILGIGFEKTFLLQNDLNIKVSEVISTYVYKVGLIYANYSFSTAVGLFNSLVSVCLLVAANYMARKLSDTSIW
ncbi:MAG: ABC transporter permease subunit [Bacillota bacterium]|nr:ABC transporter permease subunit [Bacillota bacterium]